MKLFLGDIDEYYCDSVEGDRRWAVWSQTSVDLDKNDPARSRGAVRKFVTTLLGRFNTEEEAVEFMEAFKK